MEEQYAINDLIEQYGQKVFNLAFRITENRQDEGDSFIEKPILTNDCYSVF